MKFALFITSCLLASALGAPKKAQKVGELRPAYQKNIEIVQSGDDSRIIKGSSAKRNQFPYQVSLTWSWIGSPSHICGGSIIGESVVLTAGHCIDYSGTYTIEAGILNRGENVESRQSKSVKDIIEHPLWPGGAVVSPNDMAIMIVSSPWTWTESVQPIALPSLGEVYTGTAMLSGWGRTSSSNTLPTTLQFAEKQLITNNQCASNLVSILGSSSPLDETMICIDGDQGVASCNGDSGGPLAKDGTLIGVVSWGISPCGIVGAPSVFTRVASFVDWVNQNV